MHGSRSRLYAITSAAIILAVAVSALACSKSQETPAVETARPPEPASQPAAATRDDAARDDAARDDAARDDAARDEPSQKPADKPVAMKASPKASPVTDTAAKAAKAAVASSLAGADRRLVERPFDALPAGDFELGELYAPTDATPADAALGASLLALERGLLAGEPPYEAMGAEAAALARARFGDAFPVSFARVRFARPLIGPTQVASVSFRALADETGARSIVGLAILVLAGSDDEGDDEGDDAWRIDHLELNLEALEAETQRAEPWDPYDTNSINQ